MRQWYNIAHPAPGGKSPTKERKKKHIVENDDQVYYYHHVQMC